MLRGTWMVATFLACLLGVFVVPIQFSDGHHARMAEEIERSGAGPHPVVEVRQRVDVLRSSPVVGAQVADYRTAGGTATVRLHGYDQSAVVAEEEGWFVVERGDRQEVFVTAGGEDGFLAEDYRLVLDGEYDDLYLVADSWIAGWLLVGFLAATALAARRVRRGGTSRRRAVLQPVLYCAAIAALIALAYGVSFPMAAGS